MDLFITMIETLADGTRVVSRSDGETLLIEAGDPDFAAKVNAFCPPPPDPVEEPVYISRQQFMIGAQAWGLVTADRDYAEIDQPFWQSCVTV